MVKWDDNAAHKFLLDEMSLHSEKHERICIAASSRLVFIDVPINDIVRKHFKIYPKRVQMYRIKHLKGQSIGTFFGRKLNNGKFFLKDGNHRFKALEANGEELFRLAYDPEGKI